MKSTKATIIVLIIAVLGFAGMITALILSGITKKNDADLVGNSAGNLYNLGLFCEVNGNIYFANPDDDGTLYKMTSDCTDITKVYEDKIRYINSDGNYIYYARVNNLKADGGSMFTFYNTGLYRINIKGGARLKTLCTDATAALLLVGNSVFFQGLDPSVGLTFRLASTDGKSTNTITTESIYPASYSDGAIFYSGVAKDRNIWSYNVTTGDKLLIYEGWTYMPIATADWIYFIDVEDYHIYKTNYGGPKKEVIDKAVCTYNITPDGRYLFYQADRTDSNYIGVLDLVNGTEYKILDGNFKYINVTSNYAFFTTFEEDVTYAYALDGSGSLNLFKPGKAK